MGKTKIISKLKDFFKENEWDMNLVTIALVALLCNILIKRA